MERFPTMSSTLKNTGFAMAIAAASLFAAGSAQASSDMSHAKEANVKCYGVNVCKGHNDCKTATNACKGTAKCKGSGFVKMSASACTNIGGTTTAK